MRTSILTNYYRLLILNVNTSSGFTLIELFVVILIIGILSVIGFNSFLNFAPKAKQSEAKTAISSINSAQNSYRLEHHTFANSINQLSLGLPTRTTNYDYNIIDANDRIATVEAVTTNTALKSYVGASEKYVVGNDVEISSIICESATGNNIAATPITGKPGVGGCGTDKELGQ